jgi:FkbM family methyltransferase
MYLENCRTLYNRSKAFFKSTRTAIDIGSKFGAYAYFMHEEFDHIHCFDMRNKMRWRELPEGKITFHNVALGNHMGKIRYTQAHTDTAGEHEAELATLDSFGFQSVDHIKIDVEGDELVVLQGSEQTILKWHPVITLEQKILTEELNKGVETQATELLRSYGYSVVDSPPGNQIMIYSI